MKKIFLLCLAFYFCAAVASLEAAPERGAGDAAETGIAVVSEDALPEALNHPDGDEVPEETDDPDKWDDEWNSEEGKALRSGDPLDELMRVLRQPFDGAAYGLEGHYEVLEEENGILEADGASSRVRLVALRKEGGQYNRGLLLEITPPEDAPFVVPLSDDVRGVSAQMSLQNFTSDKKSEIFLSVRNGLGNEERFLIVSLEGQDGQGSPKGREGRVLYDSQNTRLPTVRGRFFDGYRAEIFVEETQTRGFIDLSSRREIYNRSFTYNEGSGRLRSPVTMWWNRYAELEPADLDGDGLLELKGLIILNGAGRADQVAYVAPTLKYWQGRWLVVECLVVPVEDLANLAMPRILN